jgi:hypothetical protein
MGELNSEEMEHSLIVAVLDDATSPGCIGPNIEVIWPRRLVCMIVAGVLGGRGKVETAAIIANPSGIALTGLVTFYADSVQATVFVCYAALGKGK